jgi:hypothetical protein
MSHNALGPREYIIIPEPQHSISFALKPTIAGAVRGALQMLAAVNLDDEHRLHASEVDNVRSDRNLATKTPICKLPPA